VETSLHDIINYNFVVHMHPTAVNGVMCATKAEQITSDIFGPDSLYIPYIDPGYTLFKEVKCRIEAFRSQRGFDPKVILLQNHGIFVASNSTDEIREIYERIIKRVYSQVKNAIPQNELGLPETLVDIIPAIRMIASNEGLKAVKVRFNGLTNHFSSARDLFDKISIPFTPDIIVYCKSKYLFVDDISSTSSAIEQFKTLRDQFISSNGYEPKVVMIKGIGLVAIGDNSAQAEIILDVFEDMLKIAWIAESFGGPNPMTDDQIRFIDNWEVENYRRSIAAVASRGRVENRTIVITGAAQGFGEGIAREMKMQGANIVVADLNRDKGLETAARLNELSGGSRALFVETDVSKPSSVENLVKVAVANFGAIDVFVSNAGILRAGGLDEMEPEVFDLVTKINYNAYFYCVKHVAKVMKTQTRYKKGYMADIIQVNSKSGLAGSKKNFAYAGGKFGGVGLTQSFALELASDMIKVNSVCPGNFYDGPLWSDPETGLFVQYLKAGKVPGAKTIEDVMDFYLAQAPIRRGCTVGDVAVAILYLIEQQYETGQALPVTGGQVMLN